MAKDKSFLSAQHRSKAICKPLYHHNLPWLKKTGHPDKHNASTHTSSYFIQLTNKALNYLIKNSWLYFIGYYDSFFGVNMTCDCESVWLCFPYQAIGEVTRVESSAYREGDEAQTLFVRPICWGQTDLIIAPHMRAGHVMCLFLLGTIQTINTYRGLFNKIRCVNVGEQDCEGKMQNNCNFTFWYVFLKVGFVHDF